MGTPEILQCIESGREGSFNLSDVGGIIGSINLVRGDVHLCTVLSGDRQVNNMDEIDRMLAENGLPALSTKVRPQIEELFPKV